MSNFKKFDATARDSAYWQTLETIQTRNEFDLGQMFHNFAAYIRRRDLARLLAHYELFKHVIDLPGCIVECGVYRGGSFFTWSKLLETFCPGDRSRKVFGFDHFEGLQDFIAEDGTDSKIHRKVTGGFCSLQADIEDPVEAHNADNLIPGVERCRLISGDVAKTLPAFLESEPGLRIALLHLDMDLYNPTKAALDVLYDSVLPGGLIVFDEYGQIPWEGETLAAEAFFRARNIEFRPKKLPFCSTPHGYIIKS